MRAVALTAVLAAAFTVCSTGVAMANIWVDITDATWQSTYGIRAEDAALVAQGRSDGTFGPAETVNRGQFAKMTTSGLYISPTAPEVPTFRDVSSGHVFFSHIEGCSAARVLSGFSDGSFRPGAAVTRQQAGSILGNWLAGQEIGANAGIVGARGTYASLGDWYASEGRPHLAGFADAQSVSSTHQATAAYLVYRGIMVGSSAGSPSYLRPTTSLNRAQAVALVLRTANEAQKITRPAIASIAPATGSPTGGNPVIIRGRGFVDVVGVRFGGTSAGSFSVTSPSEIVAVAPEHGAGIVDIEVATVRGVSERVGAGLYTYASDGVTSVVLNGGQTPLRGVWDGTAERLASFLLGTRPSPLFSVPTLALAEYYIRYAAEAQLRADLLWAQMIHETGYGMYGGDVLPEQNNYAGLGATGGGVPGLVFPTAEAGVMAHVAHMVAYVYVDSPVPWANATTNPRFNLVRPRGAAVVLADLNGRWAVPGTTYGQSIENIARAINAY